MPRSRPGTKIIVYSALFGDIDKPPPAPKREPGVRYVLFTDKKVKVPGWRVVVVQPQFAPRLQARFYKVHSMRFFPRVEHTVWLAGNVRLTIPVLELIEIVGNHNIAALKHFHRDCVYEEAKTCLEMLKDDSKHLKAQIAFYRENDVPEHGGLAATGLLVRSRADVVEAFEKYWWAHIATFSLRDQISFPVAVQQTGEEWLSIETELSVYHIEEHDKKDPKPAKWQTIPGAAYTGAERELTKVIASIGTDMAHPDGCVMLCIGIMWGASLHCLRAGNSRAALYGVDVDFETYKVKGDPQAVYIQGRSQEVHTDFELPINVLMIDGAHDYKSVKGDIAGWVPKVPVGGHVIFHDYAPAPQDLALFPEIVGVQQAVDEWKTDAWEVAGVANSIIAFKRVE